MIHTYIYGIPHGFNFFENDVEYLEYFKAFYISSRRGRRMVVNRRENGETIYSYLQYGLREVERQPLHAFFGMSMVFDNYEYCADFKTLLNWFDTIYDKFIKEHGIISLDTDGNYRYQVHRFEEKVDDVQWLKNNLPNIITKSDKVSLQKYDSSFIDGATGQVAGYKQTVSNKQLLSALRKYRWVSVSSEITEEDIPAASDSVVNVQPEIELNYNEFKDKLNELKTETLSFAVDTKKGSANKINTIKEEIHRNIKSIQDYLLTQPDSQEATIFEVIAKDYHTLKEQVEALAKKYDYKEPTPHTKYCYSCKLYKPLSEFSSPNATECRECETKNNLNNPKPIYSKRCQMCQKIKPMADFSSDDATICKSCEKKKPFDWGKMVWPMVIGIIVVGLVIAALVIWPKSCSNNNNNVQNETQQAPPSYEPTYEVGAEEDLVKVNDLNKVLDSKDFSNVLVCVEGKKDGHKYDKQIRGSIEKYLWETIEDPEVKNADTELQMFWIQQQDILSYIQFTEDDKEYWVQLEKDYRTIRGYLSKSTLTESDYNMAKSIVSKYQQIPKEWGNSIQDKWNKQNAPQHYTITYTTSEGELITKNINGKTGVDAKKGTSFTVKAPNGKTILENSKEVLQETADTQKVIHCDNKNEVTITPKQKFNSL